LIAARRAATLAALSAVHPEEAQQLVADVAKILTTEFNYQPTGGMRSTSNGFAGIPGKVGGEDHWRNLLDNIRHGHELHASIRDFASMLIASGMNSGAATHLLQSLVELSDVPHDQRWESRFRDVPRAIDSARKFR
jgi:type II secretory pathway component PulK